VYEIKITTADINRRLDKYLFMYFSNAPHSLVYKLLRKKRIKLNGNRAAGGELLADGDIIGMYLAKETIDNLRNKITICASADSTSHKAQNNEKKSTPKLKPSDIVYEDKNLLIINKPAGMPSHGGMKQKDAHLLARVIHYLRETGEYPHNATFTPALCNRLDVNTSGLVICGKNYQAVRAINTAFANEGSIKKFYLAVVEGKLYGAKTLEAHYQKDTVSNIARITNHSSDPQIITEYKSLAVSRGHTLVQINPITGRSHQIRVHLSSIGHPLLGDVKYGGKTDYKKQGQLLHCHKLRITTQILEYPINTEWKAELPQGFVKIINEWFGNINI